MISTQAYEHVCTARTSGKDEKEKWWRISVESEDHSLLRGPHPVPSITLMKYASRN